MRNEIEENQIKKRNRINDIKAIIILLIIIIISFLLSGCTKSDIFSTYKSATDYCYNKTFNNDSCGIERCIMINSAQFTDTIKFSAEKNYLQCQLLHCTNSR